MITRLLTALLVLVALYRGYVQLRKLLGWNKAKPDQMNQDESSKNGRDAENVVELKRDPKDGVFRSDDDDPDKI